MQRLQTLELLEYWAILVFRTGHFILEIPFKSWIFT